MLVSSIIMKIIDRGMLKLFQIIGMKKKAAKALVEKFKRAKLSVKTINTPEFRMSIVRLVVMGGVGLLGKRLGVTFNEAEKNLNTYYQIN